ncbi:MAG: nitrilase-related carbon-nitrogen hydrolase [Gemmatimonadaceae bacterium]
MKVALGEYDTGWHDVSASVSRARDLARQAKAAGGDILLLPEMFATGFTMDAGFAEPEDGPTAQAMRALAATEKLWILAGIPVRKSDGRFANTARLFSPDGSSNESYEKQRLFVYADENTIYSPGEAPCIVEMDGLKAGVLICFDLRFPELFREIGSDVDAFFLIANWPESRQEHWDVLTRARAIENQCYVVAVNRIGEGGGLRYAGGSVAYDPLGNRCDVAVSGSSLRLAQLSAAKVREVRTAFPLGQPAPR